jgi:hypothetical protein
MRFSRFEGCTTFGRPFRACLKHFRQPGGDLFAVELRKRHLPRPPAYGLALFGFIGPEPNLRR